jgi:hypothetical protein
MVAVIRRYEGVDEARLEELIELAREELVPRIAQTPGFGAYYLLRGGPGVIASLGVFEDEAGAERSTEIARDFIREAGLEEAMPNPPQITAGDVVAHKVLQATVA